MDKIFYPAIWKTPENNQKQAETGREMFKNNDLRFHQKKLEKYKQIKPKRSIRDNKNKKKINDIENNCIKI